MCSIPIKKKKNKIYIKTTQKIGDVTLSFIMYNLNNIKYHELERKVQYYNNLKFKKLKIVNFTNNSSISTENKLYMTIHYYTIKYYKLLSKKFGNLSAYIPTNKKIVSYVNISMSNAFWFKGSMYYGNIYENTMPIQNIIYHELTHGIINRTLKLSIYGERGAIDEALADIVSFYLNDTPQYLNKCNYLNNPSGYKSKYWVSCNSQIDNGGIHTNSSVILHFCYLCVIGKKFTNYFNDKYDIVIPTNFEFTDFMIILFRMMNKKVKIKFGMRQFGNIFLYNAKKLKYNVIILEHIKICLRAVNLYGPFKKYFYSSCVFPKFGTY